MCGSFDVDAREKEIKKLLEELPPFSEPVKTGTVFPGQNALVLHFVDNTVAAESMKWGFPRWDGKGLIFNARVESASAKPFFSRAFHKNPVVIPCTGFYEWRDNPIQHKKEKFIFENPDANILYLAGFWDSFPEKGIDKSFTILTTEANEAVRPYHHRMPVVFSKNDYFRWLRGEKQAKEFYNRNYFLNVTLIN